MILYSLKNGIKKLIMAKPYLRKFIFRKWVETTKTLSVFIDSHHLCGYSISKSINLTVIIEESEVYELFNNLGNSVNVYLDELTYVVPNLQEITFSDITKYSNVMAIKYMMTVYQDSLLIFSVLFFEKNKNGTWNLVTRKNNSHIFLNGYQEDEDKSFENYPASLDINCYDNPANVFSISQENFDYFEERFFTF